MENKSFSSEDVASELQRFFQSINYHIEEPEIPKEFMGKPDVYGKRQEGGAAFEICGLVKKEVKDVPRMVTHLWTLMRQLGEDVEYIIALPPVNEGDLVNLLRADNNKVFKKIKRSEFNIWICNPEDKSICSVYGKPRDDLITKNLKFKDLEI